MLADCIAQFNRLCATEEACIALVHRLRWPNGFQCSRCGHGDSYAVTTRRLPLFECRECGRQTSLTSGTIMHKSRTPLRKWMLTLYIVAACPESINAVDLSALLSVTYKTAWTMLSKIRHTITETDRKTLLTGTIEGKHEIYMKQFIPTDDRLQQERSVIAAYSVSNDQPSYFKIKLLERSCVARTNLNAEDINRFAEQHVSSGAASLEVNTRFVHPYNSTDILPHVAEQAFNWINDTFHGLGSKYSQAYLDEFCFRMNYPADGGRCPFEYLVQLCLNAIPVDEPSDHFKPQPKPNNRVQIPNTVYLYFKKAA